MGCSPFHPTGLPCKSSAINAVTLLDGEVSECRLIVFSLEQEFHAICMPNRLLTYSELLESW